MYQVIKRDGSVVDFNINKISAAIAKAFDALNKQYHPTVIDMIALRVTSDYEYKIHDDKITVEDIKYVLSSYYQGTPYNPYQHADLPEKGIYRPIGISRTGVMAVLQIRGYMPKKLQGIEWVCFGANPFNTVVPVYTHTSSIPKYLSGTTMEVSTDTFYWNSRLIGALADPNFGTCIQLIERYQMAVPSKGHQLINEYDAKMIKAKDFTMIDEANEKICEMVKAETAKALDKVLHDASVHMKCTYNRADN